jgi:hypothetical protein
MFGTKEINVEERKSLGIGVGILKLAIMDYNLKTSSTGKKLLEFIVEDDTPVGADGYEQEGTLYGKVKSTNKSGRAAVTIYFDVTDAATIGTIQRSFATIADKVGVRPQLDAITASSLEEFLNKAIPVIKGKYAWFMLAGEEYVSAAGNKGISRMFKTFGKEDTKIMIVRPVEGSVFEGDYNKQTLTTEGKSLTWERTNPYDYKPLATPDAEPVDTSNTTNPLPF